MVHGLNTRPKSRCNYKDQRGDNKGQDQSHKWSGKKTKVSEQWTDTACRTIENPMSYPESSSDHKSSNQNGAATPCTPESARSSPLLSRPNLSKLLPNSNVSAAPTGSDAIDKAQNSLLFQSRNLTNVLTRLSSIIDRRSDTPQQYKDSDFKQYWMPDSSCHECYDCGVRFTPFNRRHHCRICGQIFCSKCCNQEISGKIVGYRGNLRVCTYCCKVVQKYTKRGDVKLNKEDLKSSFHTDSDSLIVGRDEGGWWIPSIKGLPDSLSLPSQCLSDLEKPYANPFDLTPQHEFPSIDDIVMERKTLTKDCQQLRHIWQNLQDTVTGIHMHPQRVGLRKYNNCILTSDILAWLEENMSARRDQAVAIGQALLDAGYIEPIISQTTVFQDDVTLYKPGRAAMMADALAKTAEFNPVMSLKESVEPLWVQEIESTTDRDSLSEENKIEPSSIAISVPGAGAPSKSTFYTSHKTDESLMQDVISSDRMLNTQVSVDSMLLPSKDSMSHIRLWKGELLENKADVTTVEMFTCPPGWRSEEQLQEENGEHLAYTRFRKSHEEHIMTLVNQLLSDECLPLTWATQVVSLAKRVCAFVRPDVRNEGDQMDVRQYVQIKKIPGGSIMQSALVHGVVCTKNVAHKKMRKHLSSPRILLLKGSIEYQRVSNKFNSLEPQILQEKEFLLNIVSKIAAIQPDILVVEKTVSSLARQYILATGITLVFNVKPRVMERISRLTQASLVHSVDGVMSQSVLGFCHSFFLSKFILPDGKEKTLMYFDGCATHLGCTVTLRGPTESELNRTKKILNLIIYTTYHSNLEVSFCMDEFAMPPPAPGELHWASLDTSDMDPDYVTPLFSPQTTLSKTAMAQLDIAMTLQANSDPLAESFHDSWNFEGKAEGRRISEAEVAQEQVNLTSGDIAMTQDESSVGMHDGISQSGLNADQDMCVKLDDEIDTNEADKVEEDSKEASSHNNECKNEEDLNHVHHSISPPKDNVYRDKGQIGDSDRKNYDKNGVANEIHAASDNVTTKNIAVDVSNAVKWKATEIIECNDHSDPLHHYQRNKDESIFKSSVRLMEHRPSHRRQFHKLLNHILVTISPFQKVSVPYIETDEGSRCELRRFVNDDVFWSIHFTDDQTPSRRVKMFEMDSLAQPVESNVTILPPHPLVNCQLDTQSGGKKQQAMLADFRARGGRIPLEVMSPGSSAVQKYFPFASEQHTQPKKHASSWSSINDFMHKRLDCLDLVNHQHLDVLFTSYSYVSANSPNPCIYPWIVHMEFYGRNDITLGGFLERFCFREAYTCPSSTCDTSMMDHIRRFVYGTGCISIVLRRLGSHIPGHHSNIIMWSWCRKCKQVTPVIPLSMDTWSMSFAKYLELRLDCASFTRRASSQPCSHSLHHDHYQYFAFKDIVASFKYRPIVLRELSMPSPLLDYTQSLCNFTKVVEETIELLHKGEEIYEDVSERLMKYKGDVVSEKDVKLLTDLVIMHQIEKEKFQEFGHMVQELLIQLRWMEVKECDDTIGKDTELSYKISDNIIQLKRKLVEAVNNWNVRISDLHQTLKKPEKTKSKRDKDIESDSIRSSVKSLNELTEHEIENHISTYITKENPDDIKKISEPLEKVKTLETDIGLAIDGDLTDEMQGQNSPLIYTTAHTESFYDKYSPVEEPGKCALLKSDNEPYSHMQRNDSDNELLLALAKSFKDNVENSGINGGMDSSGVDSSGVDSGGVDISAVDNSSVDQVSGHTGESDSCSAHNTEWKNNAIFEIVNQNKSNIDNTFDDPANLVDNVDRGNVVHILDNIPDPTRHVDNTDFLYNFSDSPVIHESSHTDNIDSDSCSLTDMIGRDRDVLMNEVDSDTPSCGYMDVVSSATYVDEIISDRVNCIDNKPGDKDNSENQDIMVNEDTFPDTAVSQPNTENNSCELVNQEDCQDTQYVTDQGWKGQAISKKDDADGKTYKRGASVKNLFSNLLSIPTFIPLQLPFGADEHHCLPACETVPVVVYDSEPSSIIAYSLSSQQYSLRLGEIQTLMLQNNNKTVQPSDSTMNSENMSVGSSKKGMLSFFSVADGKERSSPKQHRRMNSSVDTVKYTPANESDSLDASILEPTASESMERSKLKTQTNYHIELQFSDASAKFYCRVYFAEEFRQLREMIFLPGEDVFVRSLSRCFVWKATGGKSGSSFCKTFDDRFILKQMSAMEMESFEKFAPNYFEYIKESHKQQKVTVLAKILGVYRIGLRNSQTNAALKQDLLVMENLFYGRSISQTFDLKGSMRNRLVNTAGKCVDDLVLLDENLLKLSMDSPLYIRHHSKVVFNHAIMQDIQFLSSNLVMDYSLLVGIDESRELIVGIIDYIRTFTWDKKLEMVVKKSGLLGGQGRMPTVVSPELYKSRFLDAMDRYFLLVPDRWYGLANYNCTTNTNA